MLTVIIKEDCNERKKGVRGVIGGCLGDLGEVGRNGKSVARVGRGVEVMRHHLFFFCKL